MSCVEKYKTHTCQRPYLTHSLMWKQEDVTTGKFKEHTPGIGNQEFWNEFVSKCKVGHCPLKSARQNSYAFL